MSPQSLSVPKRLGTGSKKRALKSGSKYESSQAAVPEESHEIDTSALQQQIQHRTNISDKDDDILHEDQTMSAAVWPSTKTPTKHASDAEVAGTLWPSRKEELPAQRNKDKSDMLISDDLPNLQEIFMKNKTTMSNRRFQRQKMELKTSQTDALIESKN